MSATAVRRSACKMTADRRGVRPKAASRLVWRLYAQERELLEALEEIERGEFETLEELLASLPKQS
ncbi:MAG TPA: hypothetical protein VFR86_21770 [Burkholderiaceae bacterium]|nr:hypothetical protein [Burkholderiaceae bacterium]